ncbi:unnamed protein product, partial [Polarella glacialis]
AVISSSPDVVQREAIAAKFKELVAQGASPQEAALQAIKLVRQSAAGSAGRSAAEADMASPAPLSAPPEEVDVLCPGGPYTCFICTEAKESFERFLPHRCSVMPETLCCRSCFVAWVESQIDGDSAAIKCCHCDSTLEPAIVSRLVDAEHWQRYCSSALHRTLKQDAHFIWCPKCAGGGWVDANQPLSKCGWT